MFVPRQNLILCLLQGRTQSCMCFQVEPSLVFSPWQYLVLCFLPGSTLSCVYSQVEPCFVFAPRQNLVNCVCSQVEPTLVYVPRQNLVLYLLQDRTWSCVFSQVESSLVFAPRSQNLVFCFLPVFQFFKFRFQGSDTCEQGENELYWMFARTRIQDGEQFVNQEQT